jgi:hypothetical protein
MKRFWIVMVSILIVFYFSSILPTPTLAAQCSEPILENTIFQVMGAGYEINGSGSSGECNPALYGISSSSNAEDIRYRVEYYFGRSQVGPHEKKKNFNHYFYENLEYGLYWYGAENQSQKFKPNKKNLYYSPDKPTIIYVHGWQKDTAQDKFRESSYSEAADAYIYDKWINNGWNVGVFYWNQFADDDPAAVWGQQTKPEWTQAKIWTATGAQGMRWRKADGSWSTAGSPTKSAAELFYDAYTGAMANHNKEKEIRFAGHSLGSQMAVRMTNLLKENGRYDIMPDRVSLLDMAVIGEGLSQQGPGYLGGKPVATVLGEYIQDLKKKGVIFEWYKSTGLNELSGNDDSSLRTKVSYTRLWPTWDDWNLNIGQKLGRYHTHAWDWYFRSMYFSIDGPSANGFLSDARSYMNAAYYYTQENGGAGQGTSDPSDDEFAAIDRTREFVKQETKLVFDPVAEVSEGEPLTVAATLTNMVGATISNEPLTFTLYKKGATGLFDPIVVKGTTSRGKATVTFPRLDVFKNNGTVSGDYQIKVETAGDTELEASSTSMDYKVRIIPSGYIDGVVKDQFSDFVKGVTVQVKTESGAIVKSAVTDVNGKYSVGRIPVGNYKISIDNPAYRFASHDVTVQLEQLSTINFDLIGIGTVAGKVTDADNVSVNGAVITIFNDKGVKVEEFTTGPDGRYAIGDLESGNYFVSAHIRDITFYDKVPVHIAIGETETIDHHLTWLLTRFKVFTLNRDMIVIPSSNEVTMSTANTMDLNGHELKIYASLRQVEGTMEINGGKLVVKGNYNLSTADSINVNALLVMDDEADYVQVDGNFIMMSYIGHNGFLTAGVLEVKGDFEQKIGHNGGTNNFAASGTHTVVLSGNIKQKVSFDYPGSSYFNNLKITNPMIGGVEFVGELAVKNIIPPEGPFVVPSLLVNSMSFTLNSDMTVRLEDGTAELRNSTINLNGYTLTIEGNLLQSGGTMDINGGKLVVKGNYNISTADSINVNALLIMDNETDYVQVDGNFKMMSYIGHNGYLTAGVLEVKGDFEQKVGHNGGTNNFAASGTHTVVLSGSNIQKVSFASPGSSYFNNLKITNPIIGGVEFVGELVVKNMIPSEGQFVVPSLLVNSLPFTLNSDMTVRLEDGTAEFRNSTINLNGYTLTIEGDFLQSGGTMDINGGKLVVKGNYNLSTADSINVNALLVMDDEADYVQVDGNFIMMSYIGHNGFLTAGVLEVKGDFEQKIGHNGGTNNFAASGTHTVVLSGSNIQKVSFASPGSSYFNNLKINNSIVGGVEFVGELVVKNMISSEGQFVVPSLLVNSLPFTLNSDMTVRLEGGTAELRNSTINLNGYTLTIEGDFLQSGGTMDINGGKLVVRGNYNISTADSINVNALLIMDNETDYVQVDGNFKMMSYIGHNGYLTAGVLEVKGDFEQRVGHNGGSNNFYATGTHKVLLSGFGEQHVRFDSPTSSKFAILEITNLSIPGVQFLSDVSWDQLIDERLVRIESIDPLSDATLIAVNKSITILFTTDVEVGDLYDQILLKDENGQIIPVLKQLEGKTLLLDPVKDLSYGKVYTLFIPNNAIKAATGFSLGSDFQFSFTTDPVSPDLTNDGIVDLFDVLKAIQSANPEDIKKILENYRKRP